MASFRNEQNRIFKAMGIGLATAILCAVLLSCIAALILLMSSGIPYAILDYVMIGITGISVWLGAYIAGVIAKSKGLIIGAVCAAAAFILLTVCSMSAAENNVGILTPIRGAVLLLCGIAGGIIGVNRREKVRIK